MNPIVLLLNSFSCIDHETPGHSHGSAFGEFVDHLPSGVTVDPEKGAWKLEGKVIPFGTVVDAPDSWVEVEDQGYRTFYNRVSAIGVFDRDNVQHLNDAVSQIREKEH